MVQSGSNISVMEDKLMVYSKLGKFIGTIPLDRTREKLLKESIFDFDSDLLKFRIMRLAGIIMP